MSQIKTREDFAKVMEEIKEAGPARATALVSAATPMYRPDPSGIHSADEASGDELAGYLHARAYNLDPDTCTLGDFYNLRSLTDSVAGLMMSIPEEAEKEPWYDTYLNVSNWVFEFLQEAMAACAAALNDDDCDEARLECDQDE
jgi:hypothetical protein